MLPPEGPNQMSTCGEKRPLDDSQRQSVLVKPANNTNTENIRGNEFLSLSIAKTIYIARYF